MHSLVRRFLKTGILFLAAGLLIGLWMMVERELLGRFSSPYVASAHTHAILVGFVMMMILGVALWLFPRPSKEDERYSPRAAEAAYWLLTVGTAARIAGKLARPSVDALWLRVATLSAGVLQVAGVCVFFYTMWSRIKAGGEPKSRSAGRAILSTRRRPSSLQPATSGPSGLSFATRHPPPATSYPLPASVSTIFLSLS